MQKLKSIILKAARFCKDLFFLTGLGIAYVVGICFIFSKKVRKIMYKNA